MPFVAILFRYPGKGGWTFVPVPPEHAPLPNRRWGRVPVRATVDGRSWDTSVWHDRQRGPLLAVPASIRQGKGDGDAVEVEIVEREGA
jgi:Domain of unknown function (DUF1905)